MPRYVLALDVLRRLWRRRVLRPASIASRYAHAFRGLEPLEPRAFFTADLAALGITYTAGSYPAGTSLNASVNYKNIGNASSGPFNVQVHLTSDSTWGNADDILVGSARDDTGLDSNVSNNLGVTLTIPTSTPLGSYHLAVKLDTSSEVNQGGATGNDIFVNPATDVVVIASGVNPPQASLSTTDITVGGASSKTFVVTYSDNVSLKISDILNNNNAITVTGPKGTLAAAFVSADQSTNTTPVHVTYRIAAPGPSGSTWDSTDNGSYTVSVVSNAVHDNEGNPVSSASAFGLFNVNIPAGPTSTAQATNVTKGGSPFQTFTVTYSSASNVKYASLLNNNSAVQVVGPDGSSSKTLAATFVSADQTKDSPTIVVTYKVAAPDGTFDDADNGTYHIRIVAGQVKDGTGQAAPASEAGTYLVNVGNPVALKTYFDEAWYLATYPDVAAAVKAGTFSSGFEQYVKFGQADQRNPSPFFDEAFYRAHNPSVVQALSNHLYDSGFEQFVRFGMAQGLRPSAFFDPAYYLQTNPDVAAGVSNHSISSAFQHFVLYGFAEGRNPSPFFDARYYVDNNPDVGAGIANDSIPTALWHFVYFGYAEGRAPSAFFDTKAYLLMYPDAAAAVANHTAQSGIDYYFKKGEALGESPSPYFDETYYRSHNADVAAAITNGDFLSGAEHFLRFGQFDNRSPSAFFDGKMYLQLYADVAAAVHAGTVRSAFDHFARWGQQQGRKGVAFYDESYYMAKNADVATAVHAGTYRSGYEHYVMFGQHDGRSPSVFFNEAYYRSTYSDVAAAITAGTFRSGFEQFLLYGQHEKRKPISLYDENYYLTTYHDIATAVAAGAFTSGYEHYVLYGQSEGRSPSTLFNEAFYLLTYPDVAAAVHNHIYRSGLEHYLLLGQAEGRLPHA